MPSVGMQMPKIFLRGSLCNVTMKNLTEKQVKVVNSILDELKDDPLLQPSRTEFKNALKYTIKCDYLNPEAADQEYQVALWKAIVAAKYGWGNHEPLEEVFVDKKQMKKYFQTFVFNYLRQILRENKRPKIKTKTEEPINKFEFLINKVVSLIKNNDIKIMKNKDRECTILVNMFLLSSNTLNKIYELKNMYFKDGVQFVFNNDKLTLKSSNKSESHIVESNKDILVTTTSINHKDDNNIEIPSINTEEFEDPDTIKIFYDNLSDDAKKVLSVILDPPPEFISKYGNKAAKKYVADYLKLNNKQIKNIWTELKVIYTMIIGKPNS